MTSIHKRVVVLSLLGIVPIVAVYLYTRSDPGVDQMVRTRAAVRRARSWRAKTLTGSAEEESAVNCDAPTERTLRQCGNGPGTWWGEDLFPPRETLLYQHARFRKGNKRTVNGEDCRDWLHLSNISGQEEQVMRFDCIGKDDLPRQIVIRPGLSNTATLEFSGWNSTPTSSYDYHHFPH